MAIAKVYSGKKAVKKYELQQSEKIVSFNTLNNEAVERRIENFFNKPNRAGKKLKGDQEKVLRRFNEFIINMGHSLHTRHTYLQVLKTVLTGIGKDVKKICKRDLEHYLANCKSKPSTIFNIKLIIRVFFRWYCSTYNGWKPENKEDYPEIVEWIVFKRKNNSRLPEEILSEEEVKKLVSATTNFRDKAMIISLYESATRKSEFLSCKIKHLTFDKYGAFLQIPQSKTYTRKIRLISSIPDLKNWLSVHPFADNPDAPLWINIGGWQTTHTAFGGDGLKRMLKVSSRRGGIKKNVFPHILRHSRLTHLAKQGFNETELRQIAGWSKTSDMPSVYIHLSGGDIDKKILSLAGKLEEKQKEKEDVLKPKVCPICKSDNSSTAKFCKNNNCNFILDDRFALEVDKKRKEFDGLMTNFMQSGEAQELFKKFLDSKG